MKTIPAQRSALSEASSEISKIFAAAAPGAARWWSEESATPGERPGARVVERRAKFETSSGLLELAGSAEESDSIPKGSTRERSWKMTAALARPDGAALEIRRSALLTQPWNGPELHSAGPVQAFLQARGGWRLLSESQLAQLAQAWGLADSLASARMEMRGAGEASDEDLRRAGAA